jgi:hypothetical protein
MHNADPLVFSYYLNKGQLDLEEFTTSQDGNAWSSVAAINSAFYGFSSRESWSAGIAYQWKTVPLGMMHTDTPHSSILGFITMG